jgi:hypothetical protein
MDLESNLLVMYTFAISYNHLQIRTDYLWNVNFTKERNILLWIVDLVGELPVRVASEESDSYFRDKLLSNQLQAGLQSVDDLYASALSKKDNSTAAEIVKHIKSKPSFFSAWFKPGGRQDIVRVDSDRDFLVGFLLVLGRGTIDQTLDEGLVDITTANHNLGFQKLKFLLGNYKI